MRFTVFLFAVAFTAALPAAARAAVSTTYDPASRTLRVESDGADEIVVGCAGGQTTVNGLPAAAGPLSCADVVRLVVRGGPGANRIDLSSAMLGTTGSRGITSSASVSAGGGDDDVIGPRGSVVTRLAGGAGSDRLEGRAFDTYVFGTASAPEVDTIVEPGSAKCEPSFVDTDVPNRSWWTVPWDALDFSALGPTDVLRVQLAAPGGIVADHRARTVRLESTGLQPLDAVAGGAGDDTIAGACLTDGRAGDDRLTGSPSGDGLLGGLGDDALAGGDGRDVLDGGAGSDVLNGDAGADELVGGSGDDELAGGSGHDVYLFGSFDGRQTDRVAEQAAAGVDVLSLQYDDPVRVDLGTPHAVVATARDARILTPPGESRHFEGIIGGAGDDILLGHGGGNHFWGGGGSDRAVGLGGNDVYHVDWSGSLPAAAYSSSEFWSGPIQRGASWGRSVFDAATRPRSRLKIVEGRNGGRDTLDVAEGWLASEGFWQRLEGQITSGARVDLSGGGPLVSAGKVAAVAGTRGTAANLENVRGTTGDDRIVGNAAANVIEGRQGRDRISGGAGRDTCLVHRSEDVLRGCERIRARNPDR